MHEYAGQYLPVTPTFYPAYPAQTARGGVPASVAVGTALVWLLTGLCALRAALTYLYYDRLVDWSPSGREEIDSLIAEAESAVMTYRNAAVVTALLVCGGLAAPAVFLLLHAGWARVVATVFGGLAVLGVPIGVFVPAPGMAVVLALASAPVAIAAIVLLWLPSSSAFFGFGRRPPAGPAVAWHPTPQPYGAAPIYDPNRRLH